MTITRLDPGKRMSQAVKHNNTVYLAGQVANDPNGSIEQQTREVLAAIDKLLDPTAYTGLCAQMARASASRGRAAAQELQRVKA